MRNAIRRLAEETIEERQGELDRIRKEFLRHGETVSKGPEFVAGNSGIPKPSLGHSPRNASIHRLLCLIPTNLLDSFSTACTYFDVAERGPKDHSPLESSPFCRKFANWNYRGKKVVRGTAHADRAEDSRRETSMEQGETADEEK